jgi:hypothetical protein
MAQRLKRWESPRRQGRNNKGRGGSARQRQLKKQTQLLRKKLKEQDKGESRQQQKRGKVNFPLFFLRSKSIVGLRLLLRIKTRRSLLESRSSQGDR